MATGCNPNRWWYSRAIAPPTGVGATPPVAKSKALSVAESAATRNGFRGPQVAIKALVVSGCPTSTEEGCTGHQQAHEYNNPDDEGGSEHVVIVVRVKPWEVEVPFRGTSPLNAGSRSVWNGFARSPIG